MKNKIAKNERNSINMMKSQHRSRIKMGKQRPKSSIKEVKPGGQVVGQQSIEQQLITYSDISKTLSWTFYKPSEPIAPAYNNAICAWTSDEKLSSFKDVGSFNKDRTPSRSSSVQSIRSNSKSKPKLKLKNTDKSNSSHHNRNGILEKSSKTSHAAHHALRRNKSATVVGCEIISNHREGFEPKLSASMSSGFSNDKFTQDPIKKQLSFTQEVQKIITKHEFNHFEDYIDHISHYKTTVSDRINQKFKELHAPAMQVRNRASLHETSNSQTKLLQHRQIQPAYVMQNKHRPPQLSVQVESIHLRSSKSSGLMIPSLHSFERVHPQVKLSMSHQLNTGRRRSEPICHGIGIEVPVTDLTRPNSGKGDKQTKRPNVELSISSIGFRGIGNPRGSTIPGYLN